MWAWRSFDLIPVAPLGHEQSLSWHSQAAVTPSPGPDEEAGPPQLEGQVSGGLC